LKRPTGITVLALLLGYLALGAFVLTLTAETLAELHIRWQVVRLGALIYGLTAAVASMGLWKMRRWAFVAFLAWTIVVVSIGVWWPAVFPARTGPWWTPLLWVVLASSILVPLARYVRRVVAPAA
jgi:hypothetical protein